MMVGVKKIQFLMVKVHQKFKNNINIMVILLKVKCMGKGKRIAISKINYILEVLYQIKCKEKEKLNIKMEKNMQENLRTTNMTVKVF